MPIATAGRWRLAISIAASLASTGCVTSREGPASHLLVLGDHDGPIWVSLIDSAEGPWRITRAEMEALGVVRFAGSWWPSPDGSRCVVGAFLHGQSDHRMVLVRLDGTGAAPRVLPPGVNVDGTRVGWAPDGSGFCFFAQVPGQSRPSDADGSGPVYPRGFACMTFSADGGLLGSFLEPLARESTQPALSNGAERVAFAEGRVLHLVDTRTGAASYVPPRFGGDAVRKVPGWLNDGRLALICVAPDPMYRDLVFVSPDDWTEQRSTLPPGLGGVVSIHPSGSPLLLQATSNYWHEWRLLWASGAVDRFRGPWSTDDFHGWGWVPAEKRGH